MTTSTSTGSRLPAILDTDESTSARRRRGAALLVGAVVIAVLLPPVGSLAFYWLPVITGGAYLVGAIVSGPRGALWAPGLIVLGFGVGAVLALGGTFEMNDIAQSTLTGVAVGAVVAVLLKRVGVAVSATSLAVTLLLLAGFVLLTTRISPDGIGGEALLYAGLLALWGLWELRPGSDS